MKTFRNNILSALFGLYFLVAGTGFNVVHYCCNICEDEGVESVIVESMHGMSHSEMNCCENEEPEESTCDTSHHTNSCHLTRLSIEPTVLSSVLDVKKDFNFNIVLFSYVQGRLNEAFHLNSDINYQLPPPEKALLLQGRDILTAKAVLLI